MSALSIRIIPLLITIPARLNIPKIAVKLKKALPIHNPNTAPIRTNGMVKIIIAVLLNELNCKIIKIAMPMRANGKLANRAEFAFEELSISPPNSIL